MANGTIRYGDIYPGLKMAGQGVQSSTTINASGPVPDSPPTAPVVVMVAAVVLLVVLRVMYEVAPTSGKGI